MKMKFLLLGLLFAATAQAEDRASEARLDANATENLGQYVDPRIGTGDHGHVFMGASVPFGMVNAGPNQIETGWDWCSGYHESGKKIIGFAQMHLSGCGCGDLGDIGLMPAYGDLELSREGIASEYRHETETAVPGYYSVLLDRFSIMCEMTATERTALYRFTFPKGSNNARIIIDLENTIGDEARDTRVIPIDDYTLVGYRRSHGWANDQIVYFCMKFSKPMHHWLCAGLDAKYGQATFEVDPGDKVMVKVALSPTSEVNAILNMNVELGNAWDFEAVAEAAAEAWNLQLSRVKATFRTERERTIFYTAMYHYMIDPQIWCDVTGDYMGADFKVHRGADYTTLTTWSLWDTYRAAHPLATIIMPDRMRDYAKTMLAIYREWGELPVWHLVSNDTYCMVGEPAVPVLADIILKGEAGDIDIDEAYEAVCASMLPTEYAKVRRVPLRGKDYLAELGYLPYDGRESEVVGKSMEYYIAAWAAAQLAGKLGHKEDSIRFYELSMNYKRLYDRRVNVMRALDMKGEFRPLPRTSTPTSRRAATPRATLGSTLSLCLTT